ncbi:MAG TPA: hypothetical protein VEV81_14085, partial [Pyrinomonadaceae bacterium]|nr:hypothetical protein [Pyrinomonadaceae bacterium]
MSNFHIGLSLGQMGGTSALAIGERIEDESPGCHVRHLERFNAGTPYPKIIERLDELLDAQSPLAQSVVDALVIDATAAGRPVVLAFAEACL